jgi:hypothetical protein
MFEPVTYTFWCQLLILFVHLPRHMWSDTGSFEYNSHGDMKFKNDPEAYSYAGPSVPKRDYVWTTNVETI